VALLAWAERVFQPPDRAEILASTSICFDLSVFELFLPLCNGGTVVLAPNLLHFDDVARTHQLTLINTVPSVLREVLSTGVAIPESVRVVNLAGEPLRWTEGPPGRACGASACG